MAVQLCMESIPIKKKLSDQSTDVCDNCMKLEHFYMRPEVNSNRFEISNHFEMPFYLYGNLHGDFTGATFQTIARLYCTCANDLFN